MQKIQSKLHYNNFRLYFTEMKEIHLKAGTLIIFSNESNPLSRAPLYWNEFVSSALRKTWNKFTNSENRHLSFWLQDLYTLSRARKYYLSSGKWLGNFAACICWRSPAWWQTIGQSGRDVMLLCLAGLLRRDIGRSWHGCRKCDCRMTQDARETRYHFGSECEIQVFVSRRDLLFSTFNVIIVLPLVIIHEGTDDLTMFKQSW